MVLEKPPLTKHELLDALYKASFICYKRCYGSQEVPPITEPSSEGAFRLYESVAFLRNQLWNEVCGYKSYLS